MKVTKLEGYAPKYPAKGIKLGALAAAAALAVGASLGCVNAKPEIMGDFPADTELPENTPVITQAPETTGLMNFEETPECTEPLTDDGPIIGGVPAISAEATEAP